MKNDLFKLNQLIHIEKLVTKTMKGCKRSVIELYMIMPELFERGTRSYTILEPKLHKANNI